MDLLFLTMRIINGSDCDVPVRDGSGILLPIPGLERGKKVTKTFSCSMSYRSQLIGSPQGQYAVDLESRTLLRADPVKVFLDHPPVPADWDGPEAQSSLAQYISSYPRLFDLVFTPGLDRESFSFCRETIQALEKVMGELMEYYRWLSPELFAWLDKVEGQT